MPPRRRKPSGLTEEDVVRLRDQLGEGRRPRVTLSGPQFESGASGSVVRIGDPAVDGADFLTVRVKVNGVTDELAFSPAELSIGRGARTAGAGAGSAGAGSTRAGRTPTAGRPRAATAKPVAAALPAASASPAASGTSPVAARPSTSNADAASSPADPATPASITPASIMAASATPAAATLAGNSRAGRRRKVPAAPAVSVTISSSGATWSVSASRGARTITKNVPVPPGVVTAIADLLDQAGVSEAIAEINETARQQAQQRAEELRAELSDLEAVLAAHRAPR